MIIFTQLYIIGVINMWDPREKNDIIDEETIEILEVIEECKDSYDLDEDFMTDYPIEK